MMNRVFSLLAVGLLAVQAVAQEAVPAKIAWKLPSYSMVAQSMSLRECFKTFGAAQGISVVLSKEVDGVFSGEFRNVPSDEFLDRVTTLYNLIWYFDGAALYLYTSGEVSSLLVSLRYMKADEVRTMLQQLGIEDTRFPIRTASNDELILVSGPPRYVTLIAETIERADALRELRTFNDVETRLFPLQYTWADDVTMRVTGPDATSQIRGVASVLSEIMEESQGLRIREKGAASDALEASEDGLKGPSPEFRPIIKAENRLNAVLVRDVVTRMPMYERLIQQLDKPQTLVEIIVTKVELSREDALDWQLSLTALTERDEMKMAGGQNAENLASELLGKGLAGTMAYVGDSLSVNASLTALRKKGKARNVSRTSLLTVNNMAARLTDTQSYHARVVGTEVASLEEVSAGTELEVKPRIIKSTTEDHADRIWLTMQLKDGGFETVAIDSMPMTSESVLETQALVPVGESILLAGYMRDIKEDGGWGIPLLREIPILGWLFGGKSSTTRTVQRLFILTPHVVEVGQADLLRVQAARQRDLTDANEVERDAAEENAVRKEEEARMREERLILEEAAEEEYRRNEAERKLKRKERKVEREADREAWEADYKARAKGEAQPQAQTEEAPQK